ncbi:MAG: hypothetical protein ABIN11_05990 [candidate division WOR-3 bacterium]
MNVYAVLRDSDSNGSCIIKSISLTQKLQKELTGYIPFKSYEDENIKQIRFSGEYKPDEQEVLYINKFYNPFKEFDSITDTLNKSDIDNIKFLAFVDSQKIAYQSFDSRKIITPEKWFLIYSDNTYSKIDKKGLIIDSRIDALYLKKEEKLLFFSYRNAIKIFDLGKYYREATEDELNLFTKEEIFIFNEGFDKNLLSSKMRKKIFMIQKNEILTKIKNNFNQVVNYAKKLNVDEMFDKNNKKIIFPKEKKNIEKLLNFLNEDLYESPISGLIYETNSKKLVTE